MLDFRLKKKEGCNRIDAVMGEGFGERIDSL